jgi:hypothetical protein
MLKNNPETVCRLIELAKTAQGREAAVIPDDTNSPAEDWGRQMLADDTANNTIVQEFRSIVGNLDPDQQQELVALLWLGRGDYTMDEWEDVLSQAADMWTPETADYLLKHPMLASDLEEGMDAHGYDCQNR